MNGVRIRGRGVRPLRRIKNREAEHYAHRRVISLKSVADKKFLPVVVFGQNGILSREVGGRPKQAMLGAGAKALRFSVLAGEQNARTGIGCNIGGFSLRRN